MDLAETKNSVRQNSIFEVADVPDGTVHVPTGEFHDFEYGATAVFEEGGEPGEAPLATEPQAMDSATFRLLGRSEAEIARAYLGAFYYWLLARQTVNQTNQLQARSLMNATDIEALFGNLPNRCTGDVCMVTTTVELSTILGVPFGERDLRINFNAGNRFHSRNLFMCGEAVIQMPGPRKGRIIAAEVAAIVLNVPQELTPLGNDWYRTELQFKVMRPEHLLVYAV